MTGAIDTTTVSAVWLDLLSAQRPMKTAEITPEWNSKRYSALNTAYRLGYVERTGRPKHYEYRVTARCTVPPGVPVHLVLEATT